MSGIPQPMTFQIEEAFIPQPQRAQVIQTASGFPQPMQAQFVPQPMQAQLASPVPQPVPQPTLSTSQAFKDLLDDAPTIPSSLLSLLSAPPSFPPAQPPAPQPSAAFSQPPSSPFPLSPAFAPSPSSPLYTTPPSPVPVAVSQLPPSLSLPGLTVGPPSAAEFQCDPQAEMMLVIPGNISQGLHAVWAGMDPGNAVLSSPSDLSKVEAVFASGRDQPIEAVLRYLTHLASTEQNKTYMGRSPLLLAVAALLFRPSSSNGVLEMCCWLLTSLATVETNKAIMRTYRALHPLVQLLQHHDAAVRKQVMVLWSSLLKDELCKADFRQLQGFVPLVAIITGPVAELSSMALTLLCQGGFDVQVIQALVDGQALPKILPLLHNPDEQSKRMAVIIMAAISACSDGRQNDQLRQAGGVPMLVALLQSGNPFLIEKALVVLANCSVGNEDNMHAIREAGALPSIVELMQAKFPAIRQCAVMTATNLIMLSENQQPFVDAGGSRILAERLTDPDPKIAMRAAWGLANLTNQSDSIRAHLGALGVIGHLGLLLSQATTIPQDTRAQCLKCLVNLALCMENEPLFNQSGIIPLLLQYSLLPDAAIHVNALWGLVNITTNDKSRRLLAEAGGLQVIMQILLTSQNGDTQLQCLKILTNMTMNGRCRYLLSQTPQLLQALGILAACSIVPIRTQAQAINNNFSFPVDASDRGDASVLFAAERPVEAAVASAIAEQVHQQELQQLAEEQHARARMATSQASQPVAASSSMETIEVESLTQTKDDILEALEAETIRKRETEAALELIAQEEERRKAEEARLAAEVCRRRELEAHTAAEKAAAEAETQRLVKEAVLAQQVADEKYHAKRRNVAVELLVTERTYVQALNMVVKKYMNPLTACLMETPAGKTSIVTEAELNAIFSSSQLLHTYHSMLLEGLERRITQWGPETLIGDYFLQMSSFLRSYSTYVNNYDQAVATLTACEGRPAFKEAYQKLVSSSGELKGQSLYSYLIMPIQRIPRYILLFTDLAQKTRPEHPDYDNLQQAIVKTTEIAEFVDAKKAFHNDSQRMVALSKALQGLPRADSLIKPSRILYQEGELLVNKQPTAFYIMLFNDAMFITTKDSASGKKAKGSANEKYNYINQLSLIEAELTNFKGDAFAIRSELGETFRFEALPGQKNIWVKNVRKAIESNATAEKAKVRRSVAQALHSSELQVAGVPQGSPRSSPSPSGSGISHNSPRSSGSPRSGILQIFGSGGLTKF